MEDIWKIKNYETTSVQLLLFGLFCHAPQVERRRVRPRKS